MVKEEMASAFCLHFQAAKLLISVVPMHLTDNSVIIPASGHICDLLFSVVWYIVQIQ